MKNHHVGSFWKDAEKNQKTSSDSGTYAQGPEKKPGRESSHLYVGPPTQGAW